MFPMESRWRGYLPLQGGFAICVCGRKSGRKLLEDGEIGDTGVPQPQLEQTAERTALLQALDQLNETERPDRAFVCSCRDEAPGDRPGLKYAPGNGTFQIQPLCEETAENIICVIIAKNLLQACLMNRNKNFG